MKFVVNEILSLGLLGPMLRASRLRPRLGRTALCADVTETPALRPISPGRLVERLEARSRQSLLEARISSVKTVDRKRKRLLAWKRIVSNSESKAGHEASKWGETLVDQNDFRQACVPAAVFPSDFKNSLRCQALHEFLEPSASKFLAYSGTPPSNREGVCPCIDAELGLI